MSQARYFTWDRDMFTTTNRFKTAQALFDADPENGSPAIRVNPGPSATVFYKETITLDLQRGLIDEKQAATELAAYLAWCKGSTKGCVPSSVGSIPTASTISKEEPEDEEEL